jgi:hypothetical protein
MSTIIITVDLGHFKAYKIPKSPIGKSKIELIESYDSIDAHGKLVDKLSDEAGRFRLGGGRDGTSKAKGYGEPHNMALEVEKKLIKLIARDINALLKKEEFGQWHFAASKEINSKIIANLKPEVKAKLGKNVQADLTNCGKAEILSHFE